MAVRKVATPLRELTFHMGSHSVTCHPAEVTFPPLPQPKLVLRDRASIVSRGKNFTTAYIDRRNVLST